MFRRFSTCLRWGQSPRKYNIEGIGSGITLTTDYALPASECLKSTTNQCWLLWRMWSRGRMRDRTNRQSSKMVNSKKIYVRPVIPRGRPPQHQHDNLKAPWTCTHKKVHTFLLPSPFLPASSPLSLNPPIPLFCHPLPRHPLPLAPPPTRQRPLPQFCLPTITIHHSSTIPLLHLPFPLTIC